MDVLGKLGFDSQDDPEAKTEKHVEEVPARTGVKCGPGPGPSLWSWAIPVSWPFLSSLSSATKHTKQGG